MKKIYISKQFLLYIITLTSSFYNKYTLTNNFNYSIILKNDTLPPLIRVVPK